MDNYGRGKARLILVNLCSGFGCSRINCLHSSSYEAMFLIYNENRADNVEKFLFLLSRAQREPKPFLLSAAPLVRHWGGHEYMHMTQLTMGMFHTIGQK